MDTQNGQYGNQGGYQWDGTRWVPVSSHPEEPGQSPEHPGQAPQSESVWPTPAPGADQAQPTHQGQPDDAEPTLPGVQPTGPPQPGTQPSADSQPTGYLPRITSDMPDPRDAEPTTHLPPTTQLPPAPPPADQQQGGQPRMSQPTAPFSSPPSSSPPGGYGPPRTHAPLPPGFEPEEMPDPGQFPSSSPPGPASAPPGPMSAPAGPMPPAEPIAPAEPMAPPGPFSSPPGPFSSPPGPFSGPPASASTPSGPVTTPPEPATASFGPTSAPPGSAPPGSAYAGSAPAGQVSPAYGTGYGTSHQPEVGSRGEGAPQAYQPSGLTAADLQWSTEPERGKSGIWKPLGAVVGVLVLLAGAAAGGYFFRAAQDGDQPKPKPTATYGDAKSIQKSLGGDGFECANAFTRPNPVDLCFRESPDYQDAVGFQMIDKDRIGWLKLRVESNKPAKHPVKDPALKLFGTVLDQALPPTDAKAAKAWVSSNLTEDYAKNEYLSGEVGGVRMQLLPRAKQSALLWVRLTAASYLHAGDAGLPKLTDSSLRKSYRDADFACRPSEGGVSCEKKADPATVTALYLAEDQKISLVRLTGNAGGKLDQAAGPTKEQTENLLGLVLGGDDLATAKKWVGAAFDGKAHHTVLSGVEVRVAPIEGPQPSYQVDVRPASW